MIGRMEGKEKETEEKRGNEEITEDNPCIFPSTWLILALNLLCCSSTCLPIFVNHR